MKQEMKLLWSPTAFAKMAWMLNRSKEIDQVEITGFGIAEDPAHPLNVTDFRLVKAECTSAHIDMDDEALANLVDDCLDVDIQPYQCSRIWCHTHPGVSATPSGDDWDTMDRHFGKCDFAVMFILGTELATTCHMTINIAGHTTQMSIKTAVDYSLPCKASDHEAWAKEYDECVVIPPPAVHLGSHVGSHLYQGTLNGYTAKGGWANQKAVQKAKKNKKKGGKGTGARPFKPTETDTGVYQRSIDYIPLGDGWYIYDQDQPLTELAAMRQEIIQQRHEEDNLKAQQQWIDNEAEFNKASEEADFYDLVQAEQLDHISGLVLNPQEAFDYYTSDAMTDREYGQIIFDMTIEDVSKSYAIAEQAQNLEAIDIINQELGIMTPTGERE